MNVFVIPSWYPHRCHPLEGTFLREQAIAIGDLRPEWKVAVSLWGQGMARLSFAHLRESPRCFVDALLAPRRFERELGRNQWEFMSWAPTWNEGVFHGNRDAVLEANRRNLSRAEERLGRMDILHAHVSYPGGWVAMHLSRERKIPFVVTEHMGPFPLRVYESRDGSLRTYLREPLETATARVAVSPALADRIAEFGIPRPEYIPNVVDERLYRITSKPHEDPFTFFTLGGMQPVKGFPDLLHAIKALRQQLPEDRRSRIAFRLGGYGPCLGDYQRLARELGIEDCISWLGFLTREQAREEFHRCDAYVMASLHESFGVVLVEAMACGKPVVATRCGGPNSIVRPQNGRLVDVHRPDQLATAMLDVYLHHRAFDPGLMRSEFEAEFSRSAVVRRLESVYIQALASGAATA